MFEITEYVDTDGNRPFQKWIRGLNREAAAKMLFNLEKIASGNTSNMQSLRGGIHEVKIHFGPGYRIYLGMYGNKFIILLGGGTKKRQQEDIDRARGYWLDYKKRKWRVTTWKQQ